MSTSNESPVPRLKTCQTCFHAKIRCDKTQDSGLCDRCLRLGKTCIFAPARRRNAGRNSRLERRDVNMTASRSPSGVGTAAPESTHRSHLTGSLLSWDRGDEKLMSNPFSRGLLSFDRGQEFLDIFRAKMMPYFPFVVIPESMTIHHLVNSKPFLCVATMSVASHADPKLQKTVATLFSESIALRMVSGDFVSLDILQGLLVQLSWAHYQPRPRKYSQHLSLALSIVSDMRLDRPRKTSMWRVDDFKGSNEDWGADEKRALAGTYYLSSSSSVLLQKFRHFNYTPYVLECCQQLAAQAEEATDKYLPYIVHLQKLTEDVDDTVSHPSGEQDVLQANAELSGITERYVFTKSALPFPLSDSPTIHLQLNVLDLIISQSSSGGNSFGLNKFQDVERSAQDQTRLLDWLSQSISAARSLLSVVLVLPQGEEGSVPNIGWIMMYCALSIAVRLDLVAAHPAVAQTTQHLRRILDMPHTLRQIVLRLEAATGPEDGSEEEQGPFHHLAIRARRIEDFYLQHTKQTDLSINAGSSSSTLTPANSSSSNPPQDFSLLSGIPGSLPQGLPSLQFTNDGDGNGVDEWASTFMADLGTEFNFSNALPYYLTDFS